MDPIKKVRIRNADLKFKPKLSGSIPVGCRMFPVQHQKNRYRYQAVRVKSCIRTKIERESDKTKYLLAPVKWLGLKNTFLSSLPGNI